MMKQFNKIIHNVASAQTDVLAKVEISPDFQLYWFDAIGEFAVMMRLQRGMKHVIRIEKEKGFINQAGELVVMAGVNNETLQMSLPAGTWEWKDSAAAFVP